MLTKFKLVNEKGLKGLQFNGDFLRFEDIDDQLAEQLIGKTHVLERVTEASTTSTETAVRRAARS